MWYCLLDSITMGSCHIHPLLCWKFSYFSKWYLYAGSILCSSDIGFILVFGEEELTLLRPFCGAGYGWWRRRVWRRGLRPSSAGGAAAWAGPSQSTPVGWAAAACSLHYALGSRHLQTMRNKKTWCKASNLGSKTRIFKDSFRKWAVGRINEKFKCWYLM